MEVKPQSDVHLKAMLNNPTKFTPAVPIPDWNTPSTSNNPPQIVPVSHLVSTPIK